MTISLTKSIISKANANIIIKIKKKHKSKLIVCPRVNKQLKILTLEISKIKLWKLGCYGRLQIWSARCSAMDTIVPTGFQDPPLGHREAPVM